MTHVRALLRVAVVAPIGNSVHSTMSAVISIVQAVPDICISRKVFLKHKVNLNTVFDSIQVLPWRNIWFIYIQHNKDTYKPWLDDQCSRAFDLEQELGSFL